MPTDPSIAGSSSRDQAPHTRHVQPCVASPVEELGDGNRPEQTGGLSRIHGSPTAGFPRRDLRLDDLRKGEHEVHHARTPFGVRRSQRREREQRTSVATRPVRHVPPPGPASFLV